jgi:hypothetical protein
MMSPSLQSQLVQSQIEARHRAAMEFNRHRVVANGAADRSRAGRFSTRINLTVSRRFTRGRHDRNEAPSAPGLELPAH